MNKILTLGSCVCHRPSGRRPGQDFAPASVVGTVAIIFIYYI